MTEDILEINCTGLKCPLPVLRLEKALRAGQTKLIIIADDPISVIDIPLAVINHHAQLISQSSDKGVYRFEIHTQST